MLCDAHIHFIPQELARQTAFYKGIWADKVKLSAFLNKSKINKALLVYPSTDAGIKLGSLARECEIYNLALEKIIKEDERVFAACLIDIEKPEHIALELKRLKEKGFRAISLASSYKGAFIIDQLNPLFAAAENNSLPIFIHPQTISPIGFERVKDPLLMPVLEYSLDISMFLGLLVTKRILDKFKVKFIFSSLGGVAPFLRDRFDRVYTMLRERSLVDDLGGLPSQILRKVYVDTSGASFENIKLAVDLFGEDHLLWGSDYPVKMNLEENLKELDKLGQNLKDKIIYQNFLNLFS